MVRRVNIKKTPKLMKNSEDLQLLTDTLKLLHLDKPYGNEVSAEVKYKL